MPVETLINEIAEAYGGIYDLRSKLLEKTNKLSIAGPRVRKALSLLIISFRCAIVTSVDDAARASACASFGAWRSARIIACAAARSGRQ